MTARSLIPALVAVILAVVTWITMGDRVGGGTPSDQGEQNATPFIGRDAKQVVSAFGKEGRAVLEQADAVTLFTLNPHRLVNGKLSPETERLRGYGVLGKAAIDDAAKRRRLVEAVYEGLKGEGAGPAQCFWPRHGLRFVKGSETVELLICFECTWVYVYAPGAEHETRLLFGAGVKPVFDSILKPLKLPQDER